jgi:broad specificity phosphatase PhoE
MKRHYFWRHGQSKFNAGETLDFNSAMTSKGHTQAQAASAYLQLLLNKDFVVFVSPYLRCLETAYYLEKFKIRCKFVVDPRAGENIEEIVGQDNRRVPNLKTKYNYEWPDVTEFNFNEMTEETYREGIKKFIEEIPDKAVVISHMTTINLMIEELTGDKEVRKKKISNSSLSLVVDGKVQYVGVVFS